MSSDSRSLLFAYVINFESSHKISVLQLSAMRKTHSKTLQEYIIILRNLERDEIRNQEYGSILILALMEEVGEIARAYLAEHGRKPTNVKAQRDETYIHELGDLLVSILKLAIYKNINLDHRIEYTLKKIRRRKQTPKQ